MRLATVTVCLALAACSGPAVEVAGTGGGLGSSTGGRGTHTSGGIGGGTGTGGGNSGGTGGSSGGSGPCDTACAALTGSSCGVLQSWASSCVESCNASAAAASCLQTSGSDCNSLAVCYDQVQSAACLPSGSGTCDESITCANACAGQGPSCACACQSGISPTHAGALLVATVCSATNCASECSPSTGTVLGCDNCMSRSCATELALCAKN